VGWVEVNQNSMQHVRYSNVFALGDVSSTPNSKTAAAVRKQAPVVARNILHMMQDTGREWLRRLRVLPADRSCRQGHHGRVHLRREGDADPAAQSRKGTLAWVMD
jgi:NADH dehydrogenase FAD-containing subunit